MKRMIPPIADYNRNLGSSTIYIQPIIYGMENSCCINPSARIFPVMSFFHAAALEYDTKKFSVEWTHTYVG
jgi:hypothetical protein